MADDADTRKELASIPEDEPPERGVFCHRCGQVLPAFADLSDSEAYRMRALAGNGQVGLAAAELRAATGCPVSWAQLWAEHRGRPEMPDGEGACPHCGAVLRTPLAKQCRHCRRDWHDPENLRRLGHE